MGRLKTERQRAERTHHKKISRLEQRVEALHQLALGLQAASIAQTGHPVAETTDPTLQALHAGLRRDIEAARAELAPLERRDKLHAA